MAARKGTQNETQKWTQKSSKMKPVWDPQKRETPLNSLYFQPKRDLKGPVFGSKNGSQMKPKSGAKT